MKYQFKDGKLLCDGHIIPSEDIVLVLNNLQKENDNYRADEAERKRKYDKVMNIVTEIQSDVDVVWSKPEGDKSE